MAINEFPLMEESYEEGRLVEISPLFFRGMRLARYLEFYLVTNFKGINMPEALEALRRRARKLPEDDRSTVAKSPTALEICLRDVASILKVYVADPEVDFTKDDYKEFIATAQVLLREFLEVKAATDWLKLLLEDHHYAVAGSVHQGLQSANGLKRWFYSTIKVKGSDVDESSKPFYEIARLRDELFREWSAEGLQNYLTACDRLMENSTYDGLRSYAAANIFIPDGKFSSLEEVTRLRDELEVGHLWRQHTE